MYYVCCVCKNSRKDATLHHFPGCEKRLSMWLKCLNCEDLNNMTQEQLSKLFVCHKHFENKFFTTKRRLLSKAYPTLLTEDEILSGKPQDNTENMDPLFEHNYTRKRHFDHTYARMEPLREIAALSSASQNLPGTSQTPPISNASAQEIALISGHAACSSAIIPHATNSGVMQRPAKKTGSRKRLFGKIKNLNTTAQVIYKAYRKARQLSDFHKRAKEALRFSKTKSFKKLTEDMNPYARKIMEMQINLCKKHKKGRRFSVEEKLICLSIMKQSPKCYRFLHKIFILPSRSTLNQMVAKLNIKPGICPQIFELMKKEVLWWIGSW